MSNNKPPLTPNFVPGVGKLVTTRYDFEQHITGANFRHQASQIDLSPTVVIGGNTLTNVQGAIATLAELIVPPAIPSATIGTSSSNLGLITLGGDLGGTALIPRITGLQGYPISVAPPSFGNVLTWGGSSWGPAVPTSTFSTLTVSGVTNLNGITTMAGPTNLNGTTTIAGPASLTNTVALSSAVSLSGTLSIEAGSFITALSGSGFSIHSGAGLFVSSGGEIDAETGAIVSLPGATTTMSDNLAPIFATPQTRDVVQPLIVIPQNISGTYNNANFLVFTGSFQDGGSTGTSLIYILPYTKVFNKSTLTEVAINVYNFSGGTISSDNATFSFWKCAANAIIPIQLGSTATLGSIANDGTSTLIVAGLTEVINDSLYTYYGQVTSSFSTGAGPLFWAAPTSVFTNITTVGQI